MFLCEIYNYFMSITVKNTSKYYGKQKALNDVSFSIDTGEIVGFLGPNGAGKSTMMKIITAYIEANEGEVLVNGLDVQKDELAVKRSVGYLPEHNPMYPDMYIKEYLQFHANIHKVDKQRISEVIDQVGLGPEQHKKIGQLSKGYRQRVGLAAALLHDPQVLVLDEPTTGLDPNQLVGIREMIKEIGKRKNHPAFHTYHARGGSDVQQGDHHKTRGDRCRQKPEGVDGQQRTGDRSRIRQTCGKQIIAWPFRPD